MPKLTLPTVTLCAAASVNVRATIEALRRCLRQVDFAQALLLTDADIADAERSIRIVRIEHLRSARDYSFFILKRLHKHIDTEHCLLVQWDGFVIDAQAWTPKFFAFDYIGAPWPQFGRGRNVGNGGFSLRTRKLLQACADDRFRASHPEDLAICHANRSFLEDEYDIRFADETIAHQFAFERIPAAAPTFGFHGVFNLVPILGRDAFWDLYRQLDDRGTIRPDYRLLMKQLGDSPRAFSRQARLTADILRSTPRRRSAATDQAT